MRLLIIALVLVFASKANAQQQKNIKGFDVKITGAAWADTTAYGVYCTIKVDSWKPFKDVSVEINSDYGNTTITPDSTGSFFYWGGYEYEFNVIKKGIKYGNNIGLSIKNGGPNRIEVELVPKY